MVESSSEVKARQLFEKMIIVDKKSLKETVGAGVDASGECPSDFKCNICVQLLFEPVECGSCNQLFCKDCISQWMAKGKKTCPLC